MMTTTTGRRHSKSTPLSSEPFWFKDAVIYQLHVRSFFDSNGDGIGDFPGLTQKLDYLQDLGVTALWILPFYPSPLRDDGYDIADYRNINPSYGSLGEFRTFLDEAHKRGLRVITELVLNHTSDQHEWFQRSRHAKPGSRWRDFYVWSDTAEKYQDARIIFKDFEPSNWSWDPVAGAYYWHRFFSHQPDLNFDNPEVKRSLLRIVDFWFRAGVDGMRLDAVPYLYEREGTNCENLPETHAFLKELRSHVEERFSDKMLLAEANQWPDDAVDYLGDGDECHMAFHFPLMPRLFMATRMEDRHPIVDILEQTPQIPDNCQWAIFLRNHDELTLEMVTDEERDYMYRTYAHDSQMRINLGIRRRLAPLLENDRRKIELLNGLIMSLPGTPIIYYGDEIGMGDNFYLGDRNGVRTPMQWSPDRNAGFSATNPQRLFLPVVIDPEFHYETINAEAQQANSSSLLWWMKRLISVRKQYGAFSHGSLELLYPENGKVLAFIREDENTKILVAANLSKYTQALELDLSSCVGMRPVEMFGRAKFPIITENPYVLTLAPNAFHWFVLEPENAEALTPTESMIPQSVPSMNISGSWERIFTGRSRVELESVLLSYVRQRRWFRGKAKTIRSSQIMDVIDVPHSGSASGKVVLLRIEYTDGEPETYVVPMAFAPGTAGELLEQTAPQAMIARLIAPSAKGRRIASEEVEASGMLHEALADERFMTALLDAISRRRRYQGQAGELVGTVTTDFRNIRGVSDDSNFAPLILRAEQSNTSIAYGDRLILKLFRRMEEGPNPDYEIGRYLTEHTSFQQIAPVAGAIEYRQPGKESAIAAILQRFVVNQGDAWSFTLDEVTAFYTRALAGQDTESTISPPPRIPIVRLSSEFEPPDQISMLIGPYIESAKLLGLRTAELHAALGRETSIPALAPEPFSSQYQRSLYQSLVSTTKEPFRLLRRSLPRLPEAVATLAREVLARESEISQRFAGIRGHRISARRTRIHGDYHLGQVLHTGNDFVIIDFEGEPARPLSERRIKRSPLRDVASMIRSYHYASHAVLHDSHDGGPLRPEDIPGLRPWSHIWYLWVSAAFLGAYMTTAKDASFAPSDPDDFQTLLDVFLLEKALYEIGYELNNRPDWVGIPLQGILDLLDADRAV